MKEFDFGQMLTSNQDMLLRALACVIVAALLYYAAQAVTGAVTGVMNKFWLPLGILVLAFIAAKVFA